MSAMTYVGLDGCYRDHIAYSGNLNSRRADRRADLYRVHQRSNEKQARMQTALKLAEFRQAWIDNLRDTMAEFQSLGVTPGLEHIRRPEFFQSGTRIQLLMNRDDPEYAVLDECLYNFLMADTEQEKYRSNPDYIDVCQRILKREEERLRKDLEGVALSK